MAEVFRRVVDHQEPVRWHLELGAEVIARIDADEYDFPWTYGQLADSPAFERFRLYFTNENNWPEDDPLFEALCGKVIEKGDFLLREVPTGVAYRGVCLNHDGGQVVWFRHSDPA